MSDTFLRFIPVNPDFVPEVANQDRAKEYLIHIFKKIEIEVIETDDVEFVDPGANFENVYCNLCGEELETETWQEAMDEGYKTVFQNLSFITRCCHSLTSLNELKYHWPAGFAKFMISLLKPCLDIKENELKELENILGTKIRKIWAHY